jgi:hypothetical protein
MSNVLLNNRILASALWPLKVKRDCIVDKSLKIIKLIKNAVRSILDNFGTFSYPKPFLRAVRRGALAKSITGYHKNMVRKQYPVLELPNQMPVRIWIWPEPLVAPRVWRALGTRMTLVSLVFSFFRPYTSGFVSTLTKVLKCSFNKRNCIVDKSLKIIKDDVHSCAHARTLFTFWTAIFVKYDILTEYLTLFWFALLVNEYKLYVSIQKSSKDAKFGQYLYLGVPLCYEQNWCAERSGHHL